MEKEKKSFVKYIRLAFLLFLLVIAIGYYTLVNYKPKNTFHEQFVEVETGSPQWWKMANDVEALYLKEMKRFPPESKDYKIRELQVKLYQEKKKILKEREKYSTDTVEYKALSDQLNKLTDDNQKKLKELNGSK